MKQRTKEISISVASFLGFYIVVSQFILPALSERNFPAAYYGWLSLVVQAAVVVYLLMKNFRAAVVVGLVFIGLQILLQIVQFLQ